MSDLKTQLREIDDQIQELRNKRYELEKQDIMNFKEQAKANVGRCFRNENHYIKIIGIPQEVYTKTGIEFDRYNYPAFHLGYKPNDVVRLTMYKLKQIIPFYEDTIHSSIWEKRKYVLEHQYEEITPEEFNAEFEKRLQKFREQIGI